MTMSKRSGIQVNALVLPSSISISSKKVVAYQEKGYTISIPEEKRKKLTDIFFKSCGVTREENSINE